jgi:predicted PurR-regulated permease PerM
MKPASQERRLSARPLIGVLAAVLAIACLYWARSVAIPFVIAMLLAFMLSPLVRALERRRVPTLLAVILVLVLFTGGLAVIVQAIAIEVAVLAKELPGYRGNIMTKIGDLRLIQKGSALGQLQQLAEDMIEQFERYDVGPSSDRPVPVSVEQPSFLWKLSSLLPNAARAGLVLVLLLFMLLRREDLRNRLIGFFGYRRLALTTKALDEAGDRITRYLVRQTVINTGFGLAVGLGLWLIGLPYAALWGFLAATLRFIPYVGTALAALLPALLALAVFPGWTRPLLVVGFIELLELVLYVAVEPWFYGRGAGVSEVALLVGVAFWTWLWGPIGLLLGIPMTVCVAVVAKHIPGLARVGLLLSDQPVTPVGLVFYQRLIAADRYEAAQVAVRYLATHSPEQMFDDLLLPAIVRTTRDHDAGVLNDLDRQTILQAIETIARELTGGAPSAEKMAEASPDGVDVEASLREPGALTRAPANRLKALGFPVEDDADEVALRLLALRLDPERYEMTVVSRGLLASDVLAAVEREAPAAVCFGALSAGGFAHSRYLVKRLRPRFPEIGIVVWRWRSTREAPIAWRDRMVAAGANYVGTTLADVRAQLVHLVHVSSAEESARERR